MKQKYTLRCIVLILIACLMTTSCDDFVTVDPPRTGLVRATVFENDATADAAVIDIYYQLRSSAFASGSLSSISYLMSLSSDEQVTYYAGTPVSVAEYQQVNDNALQANNSLVFGLWSDIYSCIYKANAVLEGLEISSGISETLKKRLEGEAKFIRAFGLFYLVNLWGDVPLTLTTDYRTNSRTGRTAEAKVYQQIIDDLLDAQGLLPSDYGFSNNERVRANKWAATALLARTYLYSGNWQQAEIQSTAIIENVSMYSLTADLKSVFNTNSSEAILQWWNNLRPNERSIFRFFSTPFYGALRPEFVEGFEDSDLRETAWINFTSAGYYSTIKYESPAINPPMQYSTVLRLAEQYLIRAEARAQQDDVTGAQADINTIRNRAGLDDTAASDKTTLMQAVEQERRSELFNEWGHRWFDLKRTNRASSVIGVIKNGWVDTAVLLPIPESEMLNNTALANSQNPGY